MELNTITKYSKYIAILEKINEEAIPECERNPINDMISTGADVIGIYKDNKPVGFFMIRKYKRICYLAYFAVEKTLRSQGIGSAALKVLLGKYSDYQFIVEFEASPNNADDDINARRKNFYLRNGFYETGWFTYYDDTEFEIAGSQDNFDINAFNEFTEYLGTIISDHIPKPYQKNI